MHSGACGPVSTVKTEGGLMASELLLKSGTAGSTYRGTRRGETVLSSGYQTSFDSSHTFLGTQWGLGGGTALMGDDDEDDFDDDDDDDAFDDDEEESEGDEEADDDDEDFLEDDEEEEDDDEFGEEDDDDDDEDF